MLNYCKYLLFILVVLTFTSCDTELGEVDLVLQEYVESFYSEMEARNNSNLTKVANVDVYFVDTIDLEENGLNVNGQCEENHSGELSVKISRTNWSYTDDA